MSRHISGIVTAISIAFAALGATGSADAEGIDQLDQVRQAKIFLSWFLLDHVDRPLRISDPCPSMSRDSMANHLTARGLVPSARDYGTALVVDEQVGAGVAMLRCGNDLARSADPSESTAVAVDVFMLDGRATFDEFAVVIGGNDVVVEPTAEPVGETAGRCTNGGRSCTWAVNVEGLVVTVRAVGLPAESGEQLARQLVAAVTPEIVANLAAQAAAA